MRKLLVVSFLIELLSASLALSQWSEPVRISSNEGAFEPRGVAVGETLHVVVTRGFAQFEYIKSTDNGITWMDPVMPADTFDLAAHDPDIVYSNRKLHIAWIGEIHGNPRGQIFHMSSNNGGRTWSNPHQVFNNDSAMLKYPKLATNGNMLFLSCRTERQLLVFSSTNAGVSWRDSVAVENGPINIEQWQTFLSSNEVLHLIYSFDTSPDSIGMEICYRNSRDDGHTWSERYYLSTPESFPNNISGIFPSAHADSSGNLIALWCDFKYGWTCEWYGEILGRFSTDNGTTWLPEFAITDHETGHTSTCLSIGGRLLAAWEDDSYILCSSKITVSMSSTQGTSWDLPQMISIPDTAEDMRPKLFSSISNNGTTLHCIYWRNNYPDTSGLFYIRNDNLSAISNEGDYLLPAEIELVGYPNPFNGGINIKFSNPEGGELIIQIFDIMGRKIKEYTINDAKEGNIKWDASDAMGNKVSSGIYFAKAQNGSQATSASHSSFVLKMLLIK
jgi:hypothetical protein